MSHRFIKEDAILARKGLPDHTDSFFFTLEKEFGRVIFDELCILRKNGSEYRLVYYHCYANGACRLRDDNEKEIVHDVEFFVERVLKRGILADHEGVFDLKREGSTFDAMLRIGEYFLCFNNTEQSIKSLEDRYNISQ